MSGVMAASWSLAPSFPCAAADAQPIEDGPSGAADDALSQEEAAESAISLQINVDVTNAYFYHGLVQQDTGVIVQPAAMLTIRLYERDDFAVEALLGTWSSFGENSGTATGTVIRDWYESDVIAGFTFTAGKASLTASYSLFTSPSGAFDAVQELDFTFEYDDSEALGAFALQPYFVLGFETGGNGSDSPDLDPGTYFELGIGPGFSFDLGKTSVSISFPVAIGLSLSNYYQDAAGDDETFGFFQVGAAASIPLPFGDRFGTWTLNAGVAGLFLGASTAEINGGDNAEFIGTVGLQLDF